jgi:CheY-like chemotaxis protein
LTTVLLAEDDETSRDMLTLRLELNGFTVRQAVNGDEAVREAQRLLPDLLLLDMNLPVLDGWGVARQLKADAATARLPIIGVSAHAMAGDRERALTAGCDEYETKPVDWASLLPKIERLLGSSAT